MRRRTLLTGVLVWVLVVVAASAVTWTVIDGAGEDLMANGEQVETQPVPLTPAAPSAGGSASSRPGTPHRSRTPRPSPSTSPSTSTVPSTPGPTAAASPRGVERVWQGQPGLLSVRCEGVRAYNRGATPNNGYRVEVEHSGTPELEVTFKSATREYKVSARCLGGVPRFALEGGGGEPNDE